MKTRCTIPLYQLPMLLLFSLFHISCRNHVDYASNQANPSSLEKTNNSSDNERPSHILTWDKWTGNHNVDEVIYFLDGKEIGKGKSGFKKLLSEIDKLDNNSSLIIYMTISSRAKLFPFEYMPELQKELANILTEKNIHLLLQTRGLTPAEGVHTSESPQGMTHQ